MRQTIKALGWAIIILWVITLLLPITIGLSLLKFLEQPNAIGFREPVVSFSNGEFSLFAPFYINNTGYYDLSNINITILFRSDNETVSTFSTVLPNVPAGTMVNSSYNISFGLEEIVSMSTDLLTEDTSLNLGVSIFFQVAHVIGVGVSTNITIPWKAPLHDLTISEVSYDPSSQKFSLPVSFKNNAYFTVKGTVLVEVYNNRGELVLSIDKDLDVHSNSFFQGLFEITIDPLIVHELIENGMVRVYFENTQIFEEEWG
ncbi:hypothetical protein KAU92_00290 [Candidatus Bathyarchaeota archaeon]|nr:hypothetical protein [Candidatus Bathyarchaeota archaeon]